MSRRLLPVLMALVAVLPACSANDRDSAHHKRGEPASRELHTGDLAEIRALGTIRVLVEGAADRPLPRDGDPVLRERTLAEAFARHHGLEIVFVPCDTFSSLLPALEAGRGDLIAANMTVTAKREKRAAFSIPLGRTHEVLVLRRGETSPGAPEDIRGRVGMRAGTTFEATARDLASRNPSVQVVAYTGALDPDAVLDSLNAGHIDYAIEDRNRLDVFLDYREDIQTGTVLTPERPLAWGVRRNNPALLTALNEFLHEEALLRRSRVSGVADLPELKKRGKIRMITRNNAATYFLWRGQVLGFEYELARKFAEEQGLRLQVVVAPAHEDMLPMLRAGEGDFVAAFLTVTEERAQSGVRFSRPYHWASEVVVGRADEPPMESLSDLAGRRIAVRRSSSYWSTLTRIQSVSGVEFELVEAPENMETEAIMAAVAGGEFDLTVADSHLLEIEMTIRDDLRGLIQVSEPLAHGWAVHPDNEKLLGAIDQFMRKKYKGLFYNVTYQKYFERPDQYEAGWSQAARAQRLSPYDDLVRELAERTIWDWRLIVAQMYQESRFDPRAKSWAGARGLMQVLPRTAKELGVSRLEKPRNGITAGLRYLDWVWERFPSSLPPAEHTWFTLAGYNAGHGHVRDARRLARQLGLDPNRWFDNVEVAMLRLSQAEYARQARHGYVRGREPVEYVRSIRERYRAYVDLLESGESGR